MPKGAVWSWSGPVELKVCEDTQGNDSLSSARNVDSPVSREINKSEPSEGREWVTRLIVQLEDLRSSPGIMVCLQTYY